MARAQAIHLSAPPLSSICAMAAAHARAVEDVAHCALVLQGGYLAWHEAAGNEGARIERGTESWQVMTDATR